MPAETIEQYRLRKREYAKRPDQRLKRAVYARLYRERHRKPRPEKIVAPRTKKKVGRKRQDTCNKGHDLSLFGVVKKTGGRRCKECQRLSSVEYRKSGRAKEKYIELTYGVRYTKTDHCEICGATNRRLSLDHCHKTGVVRGTLCHRCNSGIGMLGDDILLLQKSIEYLSADRTNAPVVSTKSQCKQTIRRTLIQ